MKNKIIINLTKDTPAETLSELCAVIKAQGEKPKHKQPLYALNEDIEKLHARYEELFKQVRNSLDLSTKQIELEEDTLNRKYEFELEELSKERKLEYDKRQAEIEAQADEQTPFRRGWWWRLIFQPLTNRAQDIIEERAALEADITLSADERVIEIERDSFISDSGKKLTKREMKRRLKTAIKQADNADVREAFEEPDKAGTRETEQKQSNVQRQGQLSIDDVQAVQTVPTRRPRPPRSCRRA